MSIRNPIPREISAEKEGFRNIAELHPQAGLQIGVSLCRMLSKRLPTIPGQPAECVLLDRDL